MKTASLWLTSRLVLLTAVLAGRDSRLSGQDVQTKAKGTQLIRPKGDAAHKDIMSL
jgi:hypothetical protein